MITRGPPPPGPSPFGAGPTLGGGAAPFDASPFGTAGGSPFGTGLGGSPFGSSDTNSPPFGGGMPGGSPFDTGESPFGSTAKPAPSGAQRGGADRFAALDNVDTAEGGAKCQVCGTALTDEFDKVIGLCDVHQRDRRGAEGGASAGAQDTGAARWHVRTRDGRSVGPMPLEDLRTRIRQGEFSPTDEYSKDGNSFAGIAKFQEIAYLASLALGGEAGLPTGRPRTSYARAGGGAGFGRAITWALGAVLVAVVGFLVISQRNKLVELYNNLTSTSKHTGPTSPNPLKRNLANWRLKHPDVSGTAHEHLVTARARHLEDTWKGYQLAEDAFERALLLDENNPDAIAGYVENLALWRYDLSTADEIRTAQAAIKYALEIAPESGPVHRASAALGLARGELNACRGGSDKALEKDGTDGLAKLLLAGCYMEGNVQLAISEAERALKLVPELRRGDRVLAVAYSRTGRFASAFKTLDQRLKVDPNNAAVHVVYGNIARELAQYDIAQQHYKAAIDVGPANGDVQEAYLALGDMLLEMRNPSAAIAEYKKASEVKGAQPDRLARAFAGWARAEVMRERPKDAMRISRMALHYAPKDPEALLASGEAALMVGSSTTAALLAKRALEVRSGEPSALVLAGRAAAAERARERAIKYFEDAIQNDPTDPRLRGILAAQFLGLGGSQQAYTLMRKAAELDPDERLSRNRLGSLAITEYPVREAIESFRKSASEEANASVASSSMGMLYYHVGDKTRAQEAITRALKLDDSNVTALLYDAQLALEKGDARRAQTAAERILAIERGTALGHLMLARALVRKGAFDQAREQYNSALRSNPGLLAARVELAGLDLKGGERDKAVSELARAYQVNAHNLNTRRLLFEAGF